MNVQSMRDAALINELVERDGRPTIAVLKNGDEVLILNIAWGYDLDDEFAHITTNISPNLDGTPVDFFFTSDVKSLLDAETKLLLFSFTE